ncbi:hypothetical protein SANTM175S_03826 [Streptomyces antimycoticus]
MISTTRDGGSPSRSGYIQRTAHLDGGAGVHHRVGDQLAHQQYGLAPDPFGDPVGGRDLERGPVGEGGTDEPAGGRGRERSAGQADACRGAGTNGADPTPDR